MGRRIKHYSSGYQIKRKKQKRLLSGVLFALLLVILVFVGYIGAKAVSELSAPSEGDLSGVSDTLSLPDEPASGESEPSAAEPGKRVPARRKVRHREKIPAVKVSPFTVSTASRWRRLRL